VFFGTSYFDNIFWKCWWYFIILFALDERKKLWKRTRNILENVWILYHENSNLVAWHVNEVLLEY